MPVLHGATDADGKNPLERGGTRVGKKKKPKAHKKELDRLRKKRGLSGTVKTERALVTHLTNRQKENLAPEFSQTGAAYWETGEFGGAAGEAKASAYDEYVADLEHAGTLGCLERLAETTFENHLLLPNCTIKVMWDWMIICMVLYNCFMIPFEISFEREVSSTIRTFDQAINGFLVFDIVVSFRTAYIDHRQCIESNHKLVRQRYLAQGFTTDVLGSIPFDIVAGGFESMALFNVSPIARDLMTLLGLLRFLRLISNDRLAGNFWDKPMVRIFKVVVGSYILGHWFACIFFWVAISQPADEVSWLDNGDIYGKPAYSQYVSSLYWAITTMVTVGYGDLSAHTMYERILNVPILILSTLTYATIFGSVEYAVSSMSATFRKYQSKLDTVAEFTNLFELSDELSAKLHSYTVEIFHQTKGFDMDELLGALPNSVRADILLHLHHNIIDSVPLFDGVTENFVEGMILKLKTMVCLYDDYIFRQNDKSKEMYFLRSGIVEVEVYGKGVVGDLGAGSHFGEIAMLLGNKRPASMRSVTKCELSFLTQDDFAELLFVFPEYEENVRMKARAHVLRDVIEEQGAPETSVSMARHDIIYRQRTAGAPTIGAIMEDGGTNPKGSLLNELDKRRSSVPDVTLDNQPKMLAEVEGSTWREDSVFGGGDGLIPLEKLGEPSKMESATPPYDHDHRDSVLDPVELHAASHRWNMLASLFGPNKKKKLPKEQQPLHILKNGGQLDIGTHNFNKTPEISKNPSLYDDELDDMLIKSGSVFEKLHSMRPVRHHHSHNSASAEPTPGVSAAEMHELKASARRMEERLERKLTPQIQALNAKLDLVMAAFENVVNGVVAEQQQHGGSFEPRNYQKSASYEPMPQEATLPKVRLAPAGSGGSQGGPSVSGRLASMFGGGHKVVPVVSSPGLELPAVQHRRGAPLSRTASSGSRSQKATSPPPRGPRGSVLKRTASVDRRGLNRSDSGGRRASRGVFRSNSSGGGRVSIMRSSSNSRGRIQQEEMYQTRGNSPTAAAPVLAAAAGMLSDEPLPALLAPMPNTVNEDFGSPETDEDSGGNGDTPQ